MAKRKAKGGKSRETKAASATVKREKELRPCNLLNTQSIFDASRALRPFMTVAKGERSSKSVHPTGRFPLARSDRLVKVIQIHKVYMEMLQLRLELEERMFWKRSLCEALWIPNLIVDHYNSLIVTFEVPAARKWRNRLMDTISAECAEDDLPAIISVLFDNIDTVLDKLCVKIIRPLMNATPNIINLPMAFSEMSII
eukprot:GHVH01000460.1.p1 GENE.GHVH01000460.1~~GHVH01000460.1.p1  ORF type:complete len:198 (-),score=22.63 GHVH01000460.1:416-1009(-)